MQDDIVIYLPSKGCGGVETYSFELAKTHHQNHVIIKYLDEPFGIFKAISKKHDARHVAVFHGQYSILSLFHKNAVAVIHGSPLHYYFACKEIYPLNKKIKYFILGVRNFLFVLIGIFASRHVIFVSPQVKKEISSLFPFQINKSSIRYFGDKNPPNLVKVKVPGYYSIVNSAYLEKGVDRLIRLADSLDIEIEVFGVSERVVRLNHFSSLNFKGEFDRDALEEVHSKEWFIYASRYEGFPYVIFEAIQRGAKILVLEAAYSTMLSNFSSVVVFQNNFDFEHVKHLMQNAEVNIEEDMEKISNLLNLNENCHV